MDLMRVETFQGDTVAQLPSDVELNAKVVSVATDLKALRAAPVAEPYADPRCFPVAPPQCSFTKF